MADSCQMCAAKFGLMKKKLNCRVCGRAVCKNCSTKDLLLFVANDNKGAEPQLAIIRVVGVSFMYIMDFRWCWKRNLFCLDTEVTEAT